MTSMSRTAYDALEGANFSTIKELKKSARHYLRALQKKEEASRSQPLEELPFQEPQ